MDLSMRTEEFGTDDQSWLGSRYGVNEGRSVTLATGLFDEATHYPDGYLRSGLPLVKQANGSYGPYKPLPEGSTDPQPVIDGLLLTAIAASADGTTPVVGAMLDHGRVVTAKLPVTVDEAGQATNPQIIWA